MKNKELGMKIEKKCVDCLHCKVAFSPVKVGKLCFCAKKKSKKYETEFYWFNKSVCKNFVDMTA